MNRQIHRMRSPLTRRQFLAWQGAAAGSVALNRLLPGRKLRAGGGSSVADPTTPSPGHNGDVGAIAFPMRVSESRRYLVDSGGRPFFYHADTAWALPKKATLAVAREYFDRRAKDGFTAIHLHAVSKEVGPANNVNGDAPFPREGRRDFSPPGRNAAGDGDWVLVPGDRLVRRTRPRHRRRARIPVDRRGRFSQSASAARG